MSSHFSWHKLALAYYFLTAFLVSFSLLVIEIVAARLIVSYADVSLYTWNSVIAAVLAGIALGNWLSGYWAETGGETETGFIAGDYCDG